MFHSSPSRGSRTPSSIPHIAVWGLCALALAGFGAAAAAAQTTSSADSPASVPAGVTPALPRVPSARQGKPPATNTVSAKQARDADDAYLEGARDVEHKNLADAERCFEKAVHLNPNNVDYSLALIVTRENYVTELVQRAAQARATGDTAGAEALLSKARALDPDNRIVAQHFQTTPALSANSAKAEKGPGLFYSTVDPLKFPAQDIASTLSSPAELTPLPGTHDIHLHGDPQSVIRNLYSLYGIKVSFDPSVIGGRPINLDMNNVTFKGATHVLEIAANIFAVPLEPKVVLIAKDTPENRDALTPQVEETIYLPARTSDEMQELANVARNIFDLKEVSASATGGFILLRGNEQVLREVNAVYADMLEGTPEVLFDVALYELDTTVSNNVGAMLPSSAGIFSIASEAQSLISANQSLINQAVAAGLLTLNGSPLQNIITEVGFLVASGAVTATQFTNLLGIFGGGLALSGLTLGSNASFNLALNSSDVRMLDDMQILASNHQPGTFRVGSRFPVITGTYSSGVSSSLASSLSGININGTSASSLLSQFLGSSSASVPQFQFEDLGITLKVTPQVLRNDSVSVALDMKLEALAGNSIDNIPILNNRALKSTVTIPVGQTAMLATLVSTTEMKALTGIPGLSELPGFQGTDQDLQKDSTQLLIAITPHIVRNGRMQIASRRFAAVRTGSRGGGATAPEASGSAITPEATGAGTTPEGAAAGTTTGAGAATPAGTGAVAPAGAAAATPTGAGAGAPPQ